MKVTRMEVFMIDRTKGASQPWRPVGVRIHTDEGIYGDGEAALAYGLGGLGAYGTIKDFSAVIIGEDPMNIDYLWEKMYKTTFWGQNGGPIVFAAMSAIDMALWDIKGKKLGVPLYVLLGGKHRDKLRCYASQLQFGWPEVGSQRIDTNCKTTEDYAQATKAAIADGYDAIKVDFFMNDDKGNVRDYREMTGMSTRKKMALLEERVSAVREAAGDDVDIIYEIHSFMDANTAVEYAKIAEKYGCYAFEEPNTPTPQTSRYIERNINVPIANGERIYSRWQYAPYFQDGTIQMIQPDIGNAGGLTEVRKICDMAHVYDVGVQAHVCASHLSTDVAIHLEVAIPNFAIHEHHVFNRFDFNMGLTKVERQPENGYITPLEEPGIGNEWLQEVIDNAYMYEDITSVGGNPLGVSE